MMLPLETHRAGKWRAGLAPALWVLAAASLRLEAVLEMLGVPGEGGPEQP